MKTVPQPLTLSTLGYTLAFFGLLVVMMARTALYTWRIYQEMRTPTAAFEPQLTPCQPSAQLTDQQRMLYFYRSLGVTCTEY